MKTLIVYDSLYGNTEKIAQAIGQAIGQALGNPGETAVRRAGDVQPGALRQVELLIMGSPTQRFQATPAITDLLKGIPPNGLKGVKAAAFDTRLAMSDIEKTPVLAFFVKLFGRAAYADKRIADHLAHKGAELMVKPAGFYVEGMEGPLVPGELERAADWAREIGGKCP